MKNKRRDFLKYSGLAGLAMTGIIRNGFAADWTRNNLQVAMDQGCSKDFTDDQLTVIGLYGPWAASLLGDKLPSLSFRNTKWADMESWRPLARQRVMERMAVPDIGGLPELRVINEFVYDGLLVRELEWQLPYGRPTEAILLKPANAKAPLPGILGFHDHG